MNGVSSTIIVIALLALLLISVTVFKYTCKTKFMEIRMTMSALFFFIVATLSISFWPFASMTLPFTIPAFFVGILLGYAIGVRTERQKITMHGIEHYMEHFAHISREDVKRFSWWSVVNYYTIMCGLVLINLVGFTNVILKGSPVFIIGTSVVGALFIGSILPYLVHLWSIKTLRGD
jgi:hypothetical protein